MKPTRRQLTHLLYEMLPGMYIGGWQAAEYACRTKLLGRRTYVVNLANGKPMFSPLGVMVKVNDDLKAVSMSIMDRAISSVVNAMRVAMERGYPVIVHCHAGRQRSAAVIAAYIMKYEGLSLAATIQYMKTKKPDVFFRNVNFLPVLQQFEASLRPAAQAPETPAQVQAAQAPGSSTSGWYLHLTTKNSSQTRKNNKVVAGVVMW